MASKAVGRVDGALPTERELALEIRPRRFAFGMLEGGALVDWGGRAFPPGAAGLKVAIHKLSVLLKIHAPSVVIARRPRQVKHRSSERAALVFANIQQELERRSLPFAVLTREDVHDAFERQGYRTKHEIAATIADRFDQLKPKLPRRRKAWDPERQIMSVFDAIATAIAFNSGSPDSTNDP
jgi:hypothetical protein